MKTRINRHGSYRWTMFLAIACIGLLSACNKKLDIDSARQANEEGHWTSYEDARSGVTSSASLTEWYQKYGAGLCRQAAQRLGLP